MPAGPCCVHSCLKSGESKHRFPNPEKNKLLFDKWLILCGNPHLLREMMPAQVYTGYRVCSLHFTPEDFASNRRLKKGIVPSIKLPVPLKLLDDVTRVAAPIHLLMCKLVVIKLLMLLISSAEIEVIVIQNSQKHGPMLPKTPKSGTTEPRLIPLFFDIVRLLLLHRFREC